MLVILSDLHFRENPAWETHPDRDDQHSPNLPAHLFRRFFRALGERAVADRAREIDIVLAGDILELTRSTFWFSRDDSPSPVRPYRPTTDFLPGGPEETLLGRILDRIAEKSAAGGALEEIRQATAHIHACPGAQDIPVRLSYLPGNHDRLANTSPAIRARVRRMLGILPQTGASADAFFPHAFFSPSHRSLIRHGHLYDRYNFARDPGLEERFRYDPRDPAHDEPSLGDFVTIDIAAQLPWLYRRIHGDPTTLKEGDIHRDIHRRLLQLDDLRPQSALLDFLLAIPGYTENQVWRHLEPVAVALLNRIHADPYLRHWLARLGKPGPDRYDLIRLLLDWGSLWKRGLPLGLVKGLAARLGSRRKREQGDLLRFAARETLLLDERVRFVIGGHTHSPDMRLLGSRDGAGCYYLDAGTWRERVLASPDRRHFERVKSMSYCVVYGPGEGPRRGCRQGDGLESVELWTGFSRGWSDRRRDSPTLRNRKGENQTEAALAF